MKIPRKWGVRGCSPQVASPFGGERGSPIVAAEINLVIRKKEFFAKYEN